MQVTIEVPDGLSPDELRQKLQAIQAMLQKEAQPLPLDQASKPVAPTSADPWSNPDVTLAAVDTGIEDLAHQHDHYLYGTPKR